MSHIYSIDLYDALVVGPAGDIEIAILIDHLLGRATLGHHIGNGNGARDLTGLGIEYGELIAPQMGDVTLCVGDDCDVAGRVDVGQTATLLEGGQIERKYHVRVIDYDPARVVVDGHRLGRVAELEAVGSGEDLVACLTRRGVVEGERGVARVVVAGIDHKEGVVGRFGWGVGCCVVIVRAMAQRERSEQQSQDKE